MSEGNLEPALPAVLREPSQSDPQPPESSSLYYQTLKNLRFDSAQLVSSLPQTLRDSLGSVAHSQKAMARYNKEAKVLAQHLPCESHGAAFVRIDSERNDAYRALLSGTAGTPYEHGLYLFDIVCPENYPLEPPKVRIGTTGHGSARFSPNLYNDGFVCLSIINTWDGDPAERWNSAHSNLLQVLLSIQALVMDNCVIQKEPDYEYLDVESSENILYSNIVKYNNLKWAVLAMVQEPPEEFREVVIKHFTLKKAEIVETLDRWIQQAEDDEAKVDYNHADYLVIDHNPDTFELFRNTPFPQLLRELRPLLEHALSKLLDPLLSGQRAIYKTAKMTEAGGYRHSLSHTLCDPLLHSNMQERLLRDIDTAGNSTYPSKVLLAVDSQRCELLKLAVTGEPGSDYAHGVFLFDLALPYDYPCSPPLVLFRTTGFNSIAFSSQLSSQGDVDIPLLKTDWAPSNTLKDVLTALCECFSENLVKAQDSYSSERVTTEAILRLGTLQYGIIEMHRDPPIEFKGELAQHFLSTKNEISAKTENYLSEALMFSDIEYSDRALPNPFVLQQLQQTGYPALLNSLYSEFSIEFTGPTDPLFFEEEKVPGLPVLSPETPKDPVAPESTSAYFTAMNEFRISLQLFTAENHSLYRHTAAEASQAQALRYSKEMQTLSKHLPCEAESAAYVVMGEQRMDLMQALISGPEDSPYAFGLYFIEIACPQDYPASPPAVEIRTTGRGVVRFNPNLYSDGFVCLSVINTWEGNPEEMWNPAYSNIFQVLLSIQSLVMDKEIIMKEPGYEGIAVDGLENKQYTFIVKYNNLKYAVIANIREPPVLFAATVRRHFVMVRERLIQLAAQWLQESKEEGLYTDIDPLVEDHNSATCQLFLEKGLQCAFEEVFQELQEVLNSL